MPNSPVHFEGDMRAGESAIYILILTFLHAEKKKKQQTVVQRECCYFHRCFASFKHQTFLSLSEDQKKKLFKKYSSQLNICRLIWMANRSSASSAGKSFCLHPVGKGYAVLIIMISRRSADLIRPSLSFFRVELFQHAAAGACACACMGVVACDTFVRRRKNGGLS